MAGEKSDEECEGRSEVQESSSSGEEDEQERNGIDEQKGKISEYEKQRISRIAENKARMEALGLSKMASSLMGSSRNAVKGRGKRKAGEEDEDYRPDHDELDGDDDDVNDEKSDDDEDFLGKSGSGSRKRKAQGKGSESKKKASSKKNFNNSDYAEDDDDLMKAIALSLQDSVGSSDQVHCKKKGNSEETAGKGKKKKPQFASWLQMTEDELIIYFYQFDEAGKGFITIRDLEKMAMTHDFTWTDKELADMIHCFDSDGDGKLSVDDFRKIMTRCRMLK